ncbi:MAG: hypothetical protein DLM60_02820 [Pseudonocardiales bacterium]|nr:MAG: hypothetical protein DLM60_02820 [Pseudonocardiales bacterium]
MQQLYDTRDKTVAEIVAIFKARTDLRTPRQGRDLQSALRAQTERPSSVRLRRPGEPITPRSASCATASYVSGPRCGFPRYNLRQ